MPRQKTNEIKQQLIEQYQKIVTDWKFKTGILAQRELNRMGLQKVKDALTSIQAKRENIIMERNQQLNANGQRNKIKRPSGLTFTKHIVPTEAGIMFFKNLEKQRRPNQIIKVVVQKSENVQEVMLLEHFIKWVDGYEGMNEQGAGEILDIQLYTLNLSGGCATKSGVKQEIEVNGWTFNTISVTTKDNDCIFAVMQKYKGGKAKYAKTVRKELGFENGASISTDELQKISNYYEHNIILYLVYGEKVLMLDYKCEQETEKVAHVLLLNDHYYYVLKVITPEFHQIKTKFDSLISNIVKTDDSNFEKIYEEDFKQEGDNIDDNKYNDIIFQRIVNYISENPQKHIFIHGQGGVGKSVLSRAIKAHYNSQNKQLLITSSMGISALAIDGTTIHRQLGIYKKNKKFKCDVLIDEISCIDGSLFNDIIKYIGNHRLILVGDLKQLPPVKVDQNGYFFEAMDYKEIHNNMTMIELTIVKRQNNIQFVNILAKLREGVFDDDVIQLMRKQSVKSSIAPDNCTIICSKNDVKNEYNRREINKLIDAGAQSMEFKQTIAWDMNMLKELFQGEETKMNSYMAKHIKKSQQQKINTLYVGEQIILTQNMMDMGLANGSRGTVIRFEEKSVIVHFHTKDITCAINNVVKYKKDIQELYSEKMPIVPAYAVTIHKAQGMTIETPLFVNCENMWRLELLYVALSRVTDEKLLMLYNPPIPQSSQYKLKYQPYSKLVPNQIVKNYLNHGQFSQFGFQMVIDDQKKQMSIVKRPDTNLFQLNQIDLDFETAEYESSSGLISHKPYYNHIIHYKDGHKINNQTFEDYKEGSENNDVAQMTFDLIMKQVKLFEKQIEIAKKSDDKVVISETLQKCVRLVTFNGAGFDLYFLLDKLLQTDGFCTLYQIKNIFKGNKLVQFTMYSLTQKCIVLTSFDIFQIVAPAGLQKACESYCKDQAEKLKFKNEIIYLAKNRYRNPDCMKDQETRITSEEVVTIQGNGCWKMNSLKDTDGWTIEDEEIIKLQKISMNEESFGRRYKVKIYKTMNIRKSLDEYAKNDTEVLSVLLKSLDDICHKEFKCSILNFLTVGSLCWYGFQYYAPKELFAEEIYDKNRHKKTRKHGQHLLTNLYKNELDEEVFTLKSIIGGKTGPRIKRLPFLYKDKQGLFPQKIMSSRDQFDPLTHQRIGYVYLDISGMYCDLMLANQFPYGKKRWLQKDELNDLCIDLNKNVPKYNGDKLKKLSNIKDKVLEIHDKHFPCLFICEAEFEENSISLEPVITYKKKIAGSDENPINKTMYTNEKRTQTITSVDLITILLKGGKLYNVSKCLVFENKGYILKDWMIKCLEIKNKGKSENLPAQTAFGKILSNGTYGQTLKQDKHEVIKFVDSEWDVNEFVQKYSLKNAFITESDTDILIGKELVDKQQYVTSRCSYIGSFVLAYSRLVIQDIIQTLNPEQDPTKQPLYGDTDSLVCRLDLVIERLIPAGYVQSKSGLLADELADTCEQQFFYPPDPKNITDDDIKNPDNYKFCVIYEGFFVQPKTIAIQYNDILGKEHTKIRAKGIPLNSCYGDDKQCMSYKLFIELLEKSQINKNIYDQQVEQGVDKKNLISIGQQVNLPDGLKIITPNLIQGNLNQYGQQINSDKRTIKKNEALFKIMNNQMSRKLFNTQYKGRATNIENDNIYVPYGHPMDPKIQNPIAEQISEEEYQYDDEIDAIINGWEQNGY